MKIMAACLIALFFLPGCGWVGRTAGKATAKIERKVGSVEQGYKEGYREERKK